MSNYQLSINNYQLPEGYKQTEVGVIPEDWKVLELGEIAKLERGKFSARPRNDPKFFGGKIPFIQTGDVTQSDGKITSYSQTLNEEGLSVSKLFPKKTLFFTIAANIGDMGIASFATACPDSLIAILPRSYIDKGWIFYALRFRKGEFEDLATQNAQLNINLEKLNPYRLAVPPLSEQRVIAQTLSDVDALIASLDKLIAKQRHLKTATMQQLLTGKKRLLGFGEGKGYKQTEVGVIPEDWPTLRIGNLFGFKNGLNKAKEFFGAGTPIVNYMDVFSHPGLYKSEILGKVTVSADEIRAYGVRQGDVFFTRTSETVEEIGIAAVLLEDVDDGVFSGFVLRARPKSPDLGLNLLFKKYCFDSEIARKQITSTSSYTTRALTNGRLLSQVILPCPPKLEEQHAIAAVLSDMDAAISALETRRAKTQAIKQGMMQELLTGRVRLV